MKKLLVLVGLLVLCSCEDVVEIDLPENEPRLVVEASLLWEKGTPGNDQFIRLTLTSPFFGEEFIPATGATVVVFDEDDREFLFEENAPGMYRNRNFITSFSSSYKLEINYDDEIYRATGEFVPTAPLEFIEQNDGGGFDGDDIEVRGYYQDPAEEENYYLFRFLHEDLSIQIYDDEFTNGNLTFAYFSEENLSLGDLVRFEIQGISKRFYEYMFILRSQSGNNGGGPFQTQPTTVRGNIVNTTNPGNFAFGFFRLSETDFLNYTLE